MSTLKRYHSWVAAPIGFVIGAWFPGLELHAERAPRPTITVVVYNYVDLSPKTLGDSKRVAGRILREAGISARWRNARWGEAARRDDAPPREAFGPATLVVRLLPKEMVRRLRFQPNHYGFAQCAPEGTFAFAAAVFYPRAERLARGTPSLVPVILGHLMAHEIGHLLLGPDSHSNKGIMSAPWGEPELRKARQVGLSFTASEADRVRSNVEARIKAASPRSASSIVKHHTEPEQPLGAGESRR